MVLDTQAFLNYISNQQVTWLQIYNPEGILFGTYTGTEQNPIDAVKMVELITNFANGYGGKWRMHAKRTPTSHENTKARLDVDFGAARFPDGRSYNQPLQGIQLPTPVAPVFDIKEITAQIRAEFERESTIKDLKKEIEELKKAPKADDKWAPVMNAVLSRMDNRGQQKQVQLSGTPGTPTTEKVWSEDEKKEWQEGLRIFMSVTDPTTFLGIAKKVKEDPTLLPMVKLSLKL